jgi:transcriptional regulator with XRE-family HTH domain
LIIVKGKMKNKNSLLDDRENDALRKAFGKRVRDIRGAMTQIQFGEKLGINQSMLSRLEKGYTDPPMIVLVRLSEETGKSIDDLIKG